VIGVAFDGTGYGWAADGGRQLWGGEFLVADYDRFRRAGHLRPLPLPGGDAGVTNPCRTALAYLHALGIDAPAGLPPVVACDAVERRVVRRQVERGAGCVPTTSMGRLFDVVASILGVRHRVSYEGQAAMELEALAERGRDDHRVAGFAHAGGIVDPEPVLRSLVAGVGADDEPCHLARSFHRAVADAVVGETVAIRAVTGPVPVALTGGVWQNALLSELVHAALAERGVPVLAHHDVPANDGGLSLGQAVIVGRRPDRDAAVPTVPFGRPGGAAERS